MLKTACASRRPIPRRVGENPVFVNNEERVTVYQARPSGKNEEQQETFHLMHDRVEAPDARSVDGEFEELMILFSNAADESPYPLGDDSDLNSCPERASNNGGPQRIVSVSVADNEGRESH